MPRTAGSTFRGKVVPHLDIVVLDKKAHKSYTYYAEKCEGNPPPAFAFIRNPWEWYVSMWGRVNKIRKAGWESGTFKEYMECIKNGCINHWNFNTLTNAWNTVEADKADYIGRYEMLYYDLPQILYDILNVDKGEIQAILSVHRSRKTNHQPYQCYYDPMMRRWVEEWDSELIDRFGYTFVS